MLKGTTKSGFDYEVDESAFDDMEFIDALADVNSGRDGMQISTAIRKVFDEEQRKRLYDHVRDEKGRVPTLPTVQILTEIIEASVDGKNS